MTEKEKILLSIEIFCVTGYFYNIERVDLLLKATDKFGCEYLDEIIAMINQVYTR